MFQTANDLFAHYRDVKRRLNAGPPSKPAPPPLPQTNAQRLLQDVAAAHGVTVTDIKSNSRRRAHVQARWECIWRLVHEHKLTVQTAARFMRKDHTAILNALKKWEKK